MKASDIGGVIWALIQGIFALVVIAVVVLVALATLGVDRTYYRCEGSLVNDDETTASLMFIKRERYRFPITLWAEYNGMFHLDVPHGPLEMAWASDATDYNLMLVDSEDKHLGYFTVISQAIDVKLSLTDGDYVGVCERIER